MVDYDIPVDPKSRRMAFYRGLWRILEENEIVSSGRSTQSVWIFDDEKIAQFDSRSCAQIRVQSFV